MRTIIYFLVGAFMFAGDLGGRIKQEKMMPILAGCSVGRQQFIDAANVVLSGKDPIEIELVAEETPRGGYASLLIVNDGVKNYGLYSDLLCSPTQFEFPIFGVILFYNLKVDPWENVLWSGGIWSKLTYSAQWKSEDELIINCSNGKKTTSIIGQLVKSNESTQWLFLKTHDGVSLGASIVGGVPRVVGWTPSVKIERTGAFKNLEVREGFVRLLYGRVYYEGYPKISSIVGTLR